jgi:hypothetical protein
MAATPGEPVRHETVTREKIVVDPGYAVDSVHDRPQIIHEARINHVKPATIALVRESVCLKAPHHAHLNQESLIQGRPGPESAGQLNARGDAARAGDGDQPGTAQQPAQLGQLALPSDEPGDLEGQLARPLPG